VQEDERGLKVVSARQEMAAMLEQSTKNAVGAALYLPHHQRFVESSMLKPLLVASTFLFVFSIQQRRVPNTGITVTGRTAGAAVT
jgi:hypothetical protein